MRNRITTYSDSVLGRPLEGFLQAIESFDGPHGKRSKFTAHQVRIALQYLLSECALVPMPQARQLEALLKPVENKTGWSKEDLSALHRDAQLIVPPRGNEVV